MKHYDKFSRDLYADEEGYESATPEVVADYRASRLRCGTALDCCCGIGGDTIALAKVCETVIAVDKSAERISMAKKNALLCGLKNIKFVNSDIFACDLKRFEADVVFADPQRRRDGKRVNSLDETEPDTNRLVSFLGGRSEGFCIEAPSTAEIPYDCEREYVSWDSRRGKRECILSLYFGRLRRCGISAVALPTGDRIEVEEHTAERSDADAPLGYLYEPKVCIKRALMERDLAESLGCSIYGPFLTSDGLLKSGFFENRFAFLSFFESGRLIETLRALGAGKVVLRGKMQPEEQMRLKEEIERRLDGERKLHVFVDEGIICESLSIPQNGRSHP